MEQVRTGQVHKEQICTAQTHMEQSVTYLVRRMTEGDSQAFDQLKGDGTRWDIDCFDHRIFRGCGIRFLYRERLF